MHPSIDLSTLDLDKVRKLPTYKMPPTYRLGSYGQGCAGDAPGFPTYMIQPVYNQFGNSPRKAPDCVLNIEGVNYILRGEQAIDWDKHYASFQKRCRSIWKPLPMDHPRVQLWIEHTYQHAAHCYRDVERPEHGKPGTLIYPLSHMFLASPREIRVTPGSPEAEIAKVQQAIDAELARVKAKNEFEEMRAQRVAIPENHFAVIRIREFYPEHQPNLELIANPPKLSQADWWETAAECPTPETCVPRNSLGGFGSYDWRHPVRPGHHCHFCGHTNPET